MQFSVFTKPWPNLSIDELGKLVSKMGYNAIEYPYRAGYQVDAKSGVKGIVDLQNSLQKHGVTVTSLASGIDVHTDSDSGEIVGVDETVLQACNQAQIPIIRVCQGIDRSNGFLAGLDKLKRFYDGILPYLEKYNVTVGIQMHYGKEVIANSYDTYMLVKDYDPKFIAAVWDSGHAGLAGEIPSEGLELLWNNLCMVNFKAAYWKRDNGPETIPANWEAYWTTGEHGMGQWSNAVEYLKSRSFNGTICLPAEYSNEEAVETLATKDIKYLKGLF